MAGTALPRRLARLLAGLLAIGLIGCSMWVSAARAADPIIAASGDIACGINSAGASCHQAQTANVLGSISGLSAVLPLGDVQYECGELSNFNSFYSPTWGRFKSITHPAIGNHEYLNSGSGTGCLSQGAGAPGYFTYFGSSLASPLDPPGCTSSCKGYYSYNLGTWHLIALNSNCSQPGVGGCSVGSPQYNWLKSDLSLAGGTKNCILAYWHQPRYSSGGRQGSQTQSLWQLLYDAGADVVLTGHDHTYERFDKLGRGTPAAVDPVADPNGIRAWVVGLGGRNFTSWSTIRANSLVRDRSAFGVLKLTLHANSYDWGFLPEAGKTFDSGSTTCNGPARTSTDSPPSVPAGLNATAVSGNEIDLSWNASTDTDSTGLAGYHVFRNGTQVATVTSGTSYKDPSLSASTQYSYTVSGFDTANNESAQSTPAVATTQSGGGTDSPPSVPAGLTASAASANEIDLAWNASTDTDSTGVAGYHVFRNGAPVATVTTGTSYKDASLSPSTQYSYTVSAFDTANKESAQSTAVVATTLAGGGGGTPLFSDDFESGDLSKWSGASGVVVQSSVVSSGTHAARATATGSPAFAFKTFATSDSQLYYRLRFNVQSQAATSMYLLRMRAAPNSPMMGLYVGSTGILCYRNEVALTNSCSSVSPSKGAWHTALVHVIVNGSASTVEVWLDGSKLISKTDSLGMGGVGRIELGDSASGKTFDVALDDVVVDTNPLTP
jgi:acid phosphatase type 7